MTSGGRSGGGGGVGERRRRQQWQHVAGSQRARPDRLACTCDAPDSSGLGRFELASLSCACGLRNRGRRLLETRDKFLLENSERLVTACPSSAAAASGRSRSCGLAGAARPACTVAQTCSSCSTYIQDSQARFGFAWATIMRFDTLFADGGAGSFCAADRPHSLTLGWPADSAGPWALRHSIEQSSARRNLHRERRRSIG